MFAFADAIMPSYTYPMWWESAIGGLIFGWVIGIWTILCRRLIFKKAGLPGRWALIPLYREYLRFKAASMKKRFRICISIPFIRFASSLIFRFIWTATEAWNNLMMIKWIINRILWMLLFWSLIVFIVSYFRISKNFGKWVWFSFGLRFLNAIFIWILAFDQSKYTPIENK